MLAIHPSILYRRLEIQEKQFLLFSVQFASCTKWLNNAHVCMFKQIIIIIDRNISHPCMVMTYYSFCSNSVCIEDRVIPSLLLYQKTKTHEQTLIHTYTYKYIDRQPEGKTHSHTHKGVPLLALLTSFFTCHMYPMKT